MALDLSTAAAFFWSLVGFLAILRGILPAEVHQAIDDWRRLLGERWCSRYHQVVVQQDSVAAGPNELYACAQLYLGSLRDNAEALMAECLQSSDKVAFSLAPSFRLLDKFRGCEVRWEHNVERIKEGFNSMERRSYTITLPKSSRHLVPDYLDYVLQNGRRLQAQNRQKQLFTNMPDYWQAVPFTPLATFDTLAMEPLEKQLLVNDIKTFMTDREYYTSVGRAWKRGYLLYGPPGTGKSTLISAMANLTGYDVYDLELTKVASNTDLRQLLVNITNQAIIVVEDIDCSVRLQNREKRRKKREPEQEGQDSRGITLSGLLNFIDGLWSSCGNERIFVFTTNYISKLDPALIRSGRMDMHISMSYCTPAMFRSLARVYLKIQDEQQHTSGSSDNQSLLLREIEALLGQVQMTPSDTIETLVRHKLDPAIALQKLVEQLKQQKDRHNDNDDKQSSSSSSSTDSNKEEAADEDTVVPFAPARQASGRRLATRCCSPPVRQARRRRLAVRGL